jgi:hypothetical protein
MFQQLSRCSLHFNLQNRSSSYTCSLFLQKSLFFQTQSQQKSKIHSNKNRHGDIQTQDNKHLTNRKDPYYKNLFNGGGGGTTTSSVGHKNVFFNNYRIATTLIGASNKYKNERKSIVTFHEAKQFVKSLTPNERLIIREELINDDKDNKNRMLSG